MSAIPKPGRPAVVYPDSDGKPMADNTVQYNWISTLKWNAEGQFRDRPDVFVAGDHLIYAAEGKPKVRQAPDVYVAFGRPKGDRGSYKVWEEGNLFPQVVVEVWSPNNRAEEMARKFAFYERYGAEEYYIVSPDFPAHVQGWRREGDKLVPIAEMNGFTSPRVGWRFEVTTGTLKVYGHDGRPLRNPSDIIAERDALRKERDAERDRAARLAARLRELGLDPDAG